MFSPDNRLPSACELRETWYGDEVQREYLSSVDIINPDQIAFDTMPAWYPLPGTAGKYQFSIKRTAGTAPNTQDAWANFYLRQMVGKDATKGIEAEVLTAVNNLQFPRGCGVIWDFSKSKPGEHRRIQAWKLWSSLSINQLVAGHVNVKICIKEPAKAGFPFTAFPFNVTRQLGLLLASADSGDIIFEATDKQSQTRYLYAWKVVLTTRCEYYNTMLKSGFSEGDSRETFEPMEPGNETLHRTRVKVEDDYDLLHNILFYLHTDIISFASDLAKEQEEGFPKLCPAEDIYEIADRLLLTDLKTKAFNFLRQTCTVGNITERRFGKLAWLHKDLGDMYGEFYRNNWAEIRKSGENEEFFEMKGAGADREELVDLFHKYRTVMEDDAWTKAKA